MGHKWKRAGLGLFSLFLARKDPKGGRRRHRVVCDVRDAPRTSFDYLICEGGNHGRKKEGSTQIEKKEDAERRQEARQQQAHVAASRIIGRSRGSKKLGENKIAGIRIHDEAGEYQLISEVLSTTRLNQRGESNGRHKESTCTEGDSEEDSEGREKGR